MSSFLTVTAQPEVVAPKRIKPAGLETVPLLYPTKLYHYRNILAIK